MNKYLSFKRSTLLVMILSIAIISCNKDVDDPIPNTFELPKGSTIGAALSKDSNYTLLIALINKVGLAKAVTDSSKIFTVFAPDNTAVKRFISAFTGGFIPVIASEETFLDVINNADSVLTQTMSRIVNYHVLPGLALKASGITEDFANTQYPTNFTFPAPNTNPIVRFTNFVSRRQNAAWVNNIPVVKPDFMMAANGVVHGVAAVLVPPSRLLLDTIARDPEFTYLVAAIQRADSGRNVTQLKDSSIQYFLGEPTIAPAVNFTVFAPTNQAFKDFLVPLITQALVKNFGYSLDKADSTAKAKASTPNVFSDASLFGALRARDVRGILAYHVIAGKRAFSVNFPTTPANFITFLNGVVPSHPGLTINATLNNGFGVGLAIKGLGNTQPATATLTTLGIDRHAVNGVFFKINKVLLPSPPTP
jgi:uncharacterized surface protein with fasciclin (FAS1) repeats